MAPVGRVSVQDAVTGHLIPYLQDCWIERPNRLLKDNMDKFDEYTDVLNRLVSETLRCTPTTWTHGTLTIDCDGTRIEYKLKNEHEAGAAVISETLRTLIDEFYVRMARRGEPWTQAVVSFQRDGGKVNFNTTFQRTSTPITAAPSSESGGLPNAPKPSKSWLRFWQ